jgi:hypothetical protein
VYTYMASLVGWFRGHKGAAMEPLTEFGD